MLDYEFFDLARQFRHAYKTLPNSGRPPEWAKYLLFYHAMELALKAYLLRQGVCEKKLKSHDIKKLVNKAVKLGLVLPSGSQKDIVAVGKQPPGQGTVAAHLRIRYPLGGPVYVLEQFDPQMKHLFEAVGNALGVPVEVWPRAGSVG